MWAKILNLKINIFPEPIFEFVLFIFIHHARSKHQIPEHLLQIRAIFAFSICKPACLSWICVTHLVQKASSLFWRCSSRSRTARAWSNGNFYAHIYINWPRPRLCKYVAESRKLHTALCVLKCASARINAFLYSKPASGSFRVDHSRAGSQLSGLNYFLFKCADHVHSIYRSAHLP